MKMKSTLKRRVTGNAIYAMLTVALVAIGSLVHAQAVGRVVGTVSAVGANDFTVKTDAGEEKQVAISAETSFKRLEPGQKDLSAAASIQLSDIAVGDRVLVRLDPSASTPQASLVIAMKKSDLAEKQERDREEWQRGVAGLVKSVDVAKGTILVTTGAGPTAKTVTVSTTSATVLKRYAPGSIRFADAQPAPLTAIVAGDQLRARGTKNAEGTTIAADQIVSGTFRNIAGTILQVDAAGSTLVVKDLTTKKPVTIHISAESQVRRIPERMAQMLAMRLKGAANAGETAPHNGTGAAPTHAAGSGGARWSMGHNGAATGNEMSADPRQMLNRLPPAQISELQKGEAVMVVATSGTTDVNAITLLAGVEPLLQAPAATNLLSNWSMGGGGADAAAGPQ